MNTKIVLVPNSVICNPNPCALYGKYHPDSGVFNIISNEKKSGTSKIGVISTTAPTNCKGLHGEISGKEIKFTYRGKSCNVSVYDLYTNVFSRNTGILETDKMKEKTAVIVGCGSVGSLVSLELARAGVGNFILIDADILEYHNICRHQCGIDDVGKYKTKCLKDKILKINPSAKIKLHICGVEEIPIVSWDESLHEDSTIIIGCGDNRASDVQSNRIASGYGVPFLSIGLWERAGAGEIFYWLPKKSMPCYGCALGDGGGLSGRVNANSHHIYSNQEEIESIKFEPGISADISFVTLIGVKLAIDIINAKTEGYSPRLLNDLTQYTLICNTCNPEIGGKMLEIFSYPLQVTRSIRVQFRDCCLNKCRWEKDD